MDNKKISDITADVSGEVSVNAVLTGTQCIERGYNNCCMGETIDDNYWYVTIGKHLYKVCVIDSDKEMWKDLKQHAKDMQSLTPAPKVELDWDEVEAEAETNLTSISEMELFGRKLTLKEYEDGSHGDGEERHMLTRIETFECGYRMGIQFAKNKSTAYLKSNLRPSDKLDGVDWVKYDAKEHERQIKSMQLLGINTTGQTFEQMVNSLIVMALAPTPALQELGEADWDFDKIEVFMRWKYDNRWFNFEDGLWCYTFEHGTVMSRGTYRKNYMKTTAQLVELWRKSLNKTTK